MVLSSLSIGAPFSALAGLGLTKFYDSPIIVDLVDIKFTLSLNAEMYFANHPNSIGLIPFFKSNDSQFSYLQLDGMKVIETREKDVFSTNASVGVYLFRNLKSYLQAMIFALENPEKCIVNNSYYVCPIFNGLILGQLQVDAIMVQNAEPFGKLFH